MGFARAGYTAASCWSTVSLSVNGGTLANDNSSKSGTRATLNDWISTDGVASVTVGPKGATFTTDNGAKAGTAQIACAIAAEAAEAGETAKGLTFDLGSWAFAAAGNAYEGPTVIRSGAMLFLDDKGTIPSTSTVTVGSGGELCTGGGNKTITDLVLEKDAILGFGTSSSTPYALTVTGSLTLPTYAKIALYNSNVPVTTAVTEAGTYAVLKVPAACATALAAVKWACATASSGNAYTFSVATEGDTATLSMTIAAKPADFTVAAGERCMLGATAVGSETITVNGTLLIDGNLTGTGAGGKVIVGNGGVLDVTGTTKPNATSATFGLYLNEGGSIFARAIDSGSYDTTNPIRLNGGTIYPVAVTNTSTTTIYTPRYASVLVSDGGVTYDLSHWRDGGRDERRWVRFSCNAPFDHDPSGAATDGGITVRGTPGEYVLLGFGSGFAGSTMNGGIMVEEGGSITASHADAIANQTVTLLPGSLYKPYNSTTCAKVNSLTFGRDGAATPVQFCSVSSKTAVPALAVESLSVLSPVEVSFCSGGWNTDAAVMAGVCTAMVFKAESSSVNPSLFQLPASATAYSLFAETVALTEGDYAGYTALVLTVTGEDIGPADLELKTDGTNVTLSADAAYGNIYVGDIEGAGPKSLTVTGGEISADGMYLAEEPVDGASSADKHTVTYTQSGGKVSVANLVSMHGEDTQGGRVNAEISLNGGVLDVAGHVCFGFNKTRSGYTTTLTINDSAAMTVGGTMYLTYYKATGDNVSSQGIINMNGGMLSVANDINISRADHNTSYKKDGGIFLKGGILSARNIVQTAAQLETQPQRLVFDGGVYAPNAAAADRTLTGLSKANVAAGGAIVDTSALASGGVYTIAQNLLADPALDGAADGGFTKRGTGTLVLSGANTFTGQTRVEGGVLSIGSGDAVSGDIAVLDVATLDLGGASVSVGAIAASGLVRNGSLTVTGVLAAADAGSMLAVDGDLTLAPGLAVDFAGDYAEEWRPLAAVSGTVTVPAMLKARNAGGFNRCKVTVNDGVVYVCPTVVGLMLKVR